MAVQAFLASSFRFLEIRGVTDVATIITNFGTEVLANSPAWTGANPYTSPTDIGDPRFMVVTLTRTSQFKLDVAIADQLGNTICTRRLTIPSGPLVTVRIYTGRYHFHIDADNGNAAPGYVGGGILDESPEAQNAHNHYVFGNGSFSTADASTLADVSYAFMLDNVTPAGTQRVNQWSCGDSTSPAIMTPNGARVYRPKELYCIPAGGGANLYAGRAYQALMVPDSLVLGDEVVVPIDIGTTGTFKVCGVPGSANANNRLLAMRKA